MFLLVQIHRQVALYFDEGKDDRKKSYKDGLEEIVKSSTEAACRRVEEQKRGHQKAVGEITGRLQALRTWLLEAGRIE